MNKFYKMETLVIDNFKNRDSITLLRNKEITEKEKEIVFKILRHIADGNKNKTLSKIILNSNNYNDLIKQIHGCETSECLFCNCVQEFHVNPKSLLMLTMAIHSRVPPLNNFDSWYDNFTLNSFLFQLTTVVWENYDDNDLSTYSLLGKPIINKDIKLSHPQELLFHLGNSYRVFTEFGIEISKQNNNFGNFGFSNNSKDINTISYDESINMLDKLVEKYVYFTGGTHGCDVFYIPDKSVSIDDIKEFCARYPNTTIGYILNTKTYASGHGQHWVMITFKGKYCYLICSFGGSFEKFEDGGKLTKNIEIPSTDLNFSFGKIYSTTQIQQDHSSCGMYSVISTLSFLLEAYKNNEINIYEPVKLQNVVNRIGEDAKKINNGGMYAIKGLLNGYIES